MSFAYQQRTLLKGAIARNHADNVFSLDGNELTNSYIGISSIGSTVKMGNNKTLRLPGEWQQSSIRD
jgi:hypothetical protein